MKTYFITGIGTDVGKTVVSAILTEALQADYWKPVQAGGLEQTDADSVKALISNAKTKFHPETYRLNTPASPHYAAQLDGIEIDPAAFELPKTDNNLIIEGAGGLMVPFTNTFMVVDLIKQLDVEVILVSRNYLGSINHTLMSVDVLKSRNVKIKGIVFNGERNDSSERLILAYTGLHCLLRVDEEEHLDKALVVRYAKEVKYL